MIRQTAVGLAIGSVIFASGLASEPLPSHSSTQIRTHKHKSLSVSLQEDDYNDFNLSALEKSVFQQINRYRASKGLPKLKLDNKISQQARIHSQNMAKWKVPFSHSGFEKRVKAIPLTYTSAAENLAFNQGYDDPAVEAMDGWIKSPSHLKNIVGNYDLTGIGVAANNDGEVYLTQIFLRSH